MSRKTLLLALVGLSVAGLMFHLRIHFFLVADKQDPTIVTFNPTLFLAFAFPFVDVVIVTLLFLSRKTALYGYLLNGLIVIYGTVLMAHFSIADLTARGAPAADWFLKSTLPDIAISWCDFMVGKALYDSYQGG